MAHTDKREATRLDAREFKDRMFTQFARIGAALGNAKRVEIIDMLMQGERSVDSLADQVSASVANTSRHLQILAAAGLVHRRAEGTTRIYRLSDDSVASAYLTLVDVAETHLAEVTALSEDFFSDVDGARPISLDELDRIQANGDATLVDVRPASEFEAGHVAGAVNVPFAELEARITELPADRSIVAYCRGRYCVTAARAVAQLREEGRQALRLNGGFPDWRRAEDASGRGRSHPPRHS